MCREKKSSIQHLISSIITLLALLSLCTCSPSKTENGSSTKFQQYYVQGEQLYATNCSNCHQITGTGLGLIYPPLNTSDFMEKNFKEVICLMKNGKQGELIVNGKSFIQSMPGVASLTDLEIAEIATYIYNTWSHSKGIVEVKEVTSILKDCNK